MKVKLNLSLLLLLFINTISSANDNSQTIQRKFKILYQGIYRGLVPSTLIGLFTGVLFQLFNNDINDGNERRIWEKTLKINFLSRLINDLKRAHYRNVFLWGFPNKSESDLMACLSDKYYLLSKNRNSDIASLEAKLEEINNIPIVIVNPFSIKSIVLYSALVGFSVCLIGALLYYWKHKDKESDEHYLKLKNSSKKNCLSSLI